MRETQPSLSHTLLLGAVSVLALVIVSGSGTHFVSLLASSAASLNSPTTTIFFVPRDKDTLLLGEVADVDVRINTKTPINAIGATIVYPKEIIEILGISKENSFLDLWTEETVIKEDAGEVHFSGGTLASGGLTGLGTVLTLRVRAREAGRAELAFREAEIFAHDGRGSSVERQLRTFSYEVRERTTTLPIMSAPSAHMSYRPSPDLNEDGRITLADLSILTIQIISSYNARYDLDANGALNLADLSILLNAMR